MSVSSEVRRTLVKSPPELWAELSDPTTLARHLGELGEIRITGTDPERLIDWEATGTDGAALSGRVKIEPSGWGTRVTLSVGREVVEAGLDAEGEAQPEPEPAVEPEPEIELGSEPEPAMDEVPQKAETTIAIEPGSAPELEPEPISEPEPICEPELISEPREGFFARLFRRRRRRPESESTMAEPEPEPLEAEVEADAVEEKQPEPKSVSILVEEVTFDDTAAVEAESEKPAADEQPTTEDEPRLAEALAEGEPEPEDQTSAPDIAAELAELEEQTTAVLTGVLDRLGAAHHRPFSRA